MHPALINRRAEMIELCQQLGVERLEVFGSAARETALNSEPNDFDFIATFESSNRPGYADRYLALAQGLESVLGGPVDLLTNRSIRNPIFANEIAKDRAIIYGHSGR